MDPVNEGIRVLGNRYEIGELLGRGGMAEVHLGRDARLGRVVAIKLLRTDLARDPTFQARFRREAQSAAGLNHPAIVAVYDTGEETVTDVAGTVVSLPYIVMEHVDGRTLRELLSDGRTLDVDLALEVTSGVLSALEYSHRNGIVHRDIKPANVMLTPAGDIKVMDFGIARALADASSAMTQTQAVIGTAQYLSPEQARGEQVDIRSDLYSTGCLLFELLTGRPPFVADSPVAVAYQHVREVPKPPSTFNPAVPEDVDRIVLHSLSKERDERYQTADEFRTDVENARAGRRVAAPMPTPMNGGPHTAATEYFPPVPVPGPGGGLLGGATPAAYETYGGGGYPPNYGDNGMSRRDARTPEGGSRTRTYTLLGIAVVAVLALLGWFVYSQLGGGGGSTPTPTASVVQIPVPQVKGLSEADAVDAVKTAGLVPKTVDAPSNDVEKGSVVSVSPEEGTPVAKNSEVTLTISSGPGTVNVPDVSGQSITEATQTLTSAGLKVAAQTQSEDNPDFKAGTVIRTDPKVNTEVDPNTEVTLVVASGQVDVQDVRGKQIDAATKTLEGLGLRVRITNLPSDQKEGTVLEQDPVSGKVDAGTTVNLTVAVPLPVTSTPSPPTSSGTGTPTTTTTAPANP
jgi:eukaryotic-like serine/threonine-protein kinase